MLLICRASRVVIRALPYSCNSLKKKKGVTRIRVSTKHGYVYNTNMLYFSKVFYLLERSYIEHGFWAHCLMGNEEQIIAYDPLVYICALFLICVFMKRLSF